MPKLKSLYINGHAENAGQGKCGKQKRGSTRWQIWEVREEKPRHKITGVEIAEEENARKESEQKPRIVVTCRQDESTKNLVWAVHIIYNAKIVLDHPSTLCNTM